MESARLVKIAKALADPTRQRMLREIRAAGQLNCSQICERFDLSQPTISHHLKLLAGAGLITCRKQGQYHVMSADEDVLRAFGEAIAGPPREPAAAGRAGSRNGVRARNGGSGSASSTAGAAAGAARPGRRRSPAAASAGRATRPRRSRKA